MIVIIVTTSLITKSICVKLAFDFANAASFQIFALSFHSILVKIFLFYRLFQLLKFFEPFFSGQSFFCSTFLVLRITYYESIAPENCDMILKGFWFYHWTQFSARQHIDIFYNNFVPRLLFALDFQIDLIAIGVFLVPWDIIWIHFWRALLTL